jgi:hypothetical protein
MITENQKVLMAKLFEKTGKTFQELAHDAGIRYVPDHMNQLLYREALSMLNFYKKELGKDIDGNV